MIETLHHLITPLATLVFALWAAWLSFAEEADADVPRLLADQQQGDGRRLPKSRALYVGHLALLILSGASAGAAISWWVFQPVGAFARLALGVLLVWVVGGVLPRVLAAVAPELPPLVRPAALRSLRAFGPLLRLIAWADLRFRPPAPPLQHRESGAERRDMLLGLFALGETTVAEVMTPRIDIVGVDSGAERDEVIATLLRSEHARILVYDGHIDGIVGILHAKDLLAGVSSGEDDEWHSFIRPAAFVPEGKTLDRQLRDFQRGPSHLAVVVDEFGGTAGLVTLEDILEQVVGEIQDEHDTDETQPVIEQAEGRLSVEGGVALGELESLLSHSFHREDVSTVGGLVLDAFGRVPRVGERIEIDGIELVVEQVARRRVRRIVLTRPIARVEEPVEGVT